MAALSHPNVLAIFDVGVGDVPFLVTELLDGETLRALIERGPLPSGDGRSRSACSSSPGSPPRTAAASSIAT